MKKVLSAKLLALLISAFLLAPAAAYCQDEEQPDVLQDPVEETAPVSTGPWQNSSGSAAGTRAQSNPATGTTPNALGPGGGTLRPSGATADDHNPGDNPDVPFDDNMNLAFLGAGLVFAYMALRKKWKLKEAVVKN